ncbi:Trk-type K+ transport system, membrane component [Roseovarius mucosus DSM 17069]|uniref:Trk-type K+ transport system, membrane component n=1 Tax=Roseovarius mucosus DSM 17069 TaxID=1288298 RepID=A0A0A0HQZ1_9RHOB|nr:potassium transporter TrkG [Roseovarius mucosus]KGM88488.1 Trk-type K+ transport system, membrane component [Roseovarius mucosus DSM 17069]
MIARLLTFPLILILAGIAALMMYLPAIDAGMRGFSGVGKAFAFSGTIGLALVITIGLALSGRSNQRMSDTQNLMSLLLAYVLLPVFLAIPFYTGVRNTTFINAYFEMVSSFTTTGATLFGAQGRLVDSLHLWRALVGWGGGLLLWISASAVLAPLNLGGFEVTARGEPGQDETVLSRFERATPAKRLAQSTRVLAPVYIGLTGALWICLLIGGERALVAAVHAMSTMATSGISSIGGLQNGASGFAGEFAVFLFFFFALSRLTFSSDTITSVRPGVRNDPEFRLGVLLLVGVPLILFLRHWIATLGVEDTSDWRLALRALWGAVFTVLSFLSTTGFESADWQEARDWSGLGTPGLILLGLSLVGGGVATTAGGVKLLRVYALYLHARRETERLVHPSSVGRATGLGRRIRRQGAFIAWIFFMLFAMSLTFVTALLAFAGQGFDSALILAISGLSTTGPLILTASDTPIRLLELSDAAKMIYAMAMVLGRLETLALIALLNPSIWRD